MRSIKMCLVARQSLRFALFCALLCSICLSGCGSPGQLRGDSKQTDRISVEVGQAAPKARREAQSKRALKRRAKTEITRLKKPARTPQVKSAQRPARAKRLKPEARRDLKRVAVLELANRAQITSQEVSYLTDLVRKYARALPPKDFIVITRENIIAMLPPDVKLDECIGECEVETGRRIGAHWIVTGEVIRFGQSLRIALNLHHSASGDLRSSSIVRGDVVEELERPIQRATYELLAPLHPPLTSKLPASSDERDPFAFNLPKIDLSDPELIELESLEDEGSGPVQAELKPIQMKTDLSSLKIEALQTLDAAIKGERDPNLEPQEKIALWEAVRKVVPEARERADERISEWRDHLKKRREKLRLNLNALDKRRRALITSANELSQRLEQLNADLNAREAECTQNFEKLAKVVELELFSRAQKATYTVDFARGCAPFKDYLERLGRAPYLALLSSDESARLLDTLKRDAQEARQRFERGRAELDARYQRRWGQVIETQSKIDEMIASGGESLRSSAPIKKIILEVGDQIRVKPSVLKPHFGWGQVKPTSVGVVKRWESAREVVVNFPEQSSWSARPSELELVSSALVSGSQSEDKLSRDIRAHLSEHALTSSDLHTLAPSVGATVVRGPDWKWGEQDGGEGEHGEVIDEVTSERWIRVRWRNGHTNNYRWGHDGKYDLALSSSSRREKRSDQERITPQLSPHQLSLKGAGPLLGDQVARRAESLGVQTPRRRQSQSGLKLRSAFKSDASWGRYLKRHLKPGMRVRALKEIKGNRQDVPAGAKGTFYEAGHNPPAFVVWDQYSPNGCFFANVNGSPSADNDRGWCAEWAEIEPL